MLRGKGCNGSLVRIQVWKVLAMYDATVFGVRWCVAKVETEDASGTTSLGRIEPMK